MRNFDWRSCPAAQQPSYPDPQQLADVVNDLRRRPPLVFAGEADSLRADMERAGQGKAFVLMGGDCAESFEKGDATTIRLKVQTILQMAIVLTYGASMPVVKIGRMAGQYAKPRSADTETRNGVTLPVYRGDCVNGHEFTKSARVPDPKRMLDAYLRSGTTLNLIRAFTMGGYASLSEVHSWNRGFTENPAYARFATMAGGLDRSMRFMKAAGGIHVPATLTTPAPICFGLVNAPVTSTAPMWPCFQVCVTLLGSRSVLTLALMSSMRLWIGLTPVVKAGASALLPAWGQT